MDVLTAIGSERLCDQTLCPSDCQSLLGLEVASNKATRLDRARPNSLGDRLPRIMPVANELLTWFPGVSCPSST